MPVTPIRSTTQENLDIEDITNDLVVLRDGSCCIVIKVSAINFNLLSEEEQDGLIYVYAGLLNSLSFPIQILIRSQRKDITSYLKLLKAQEDHQLSPIIKDRISAYRHFIETIVKERNVLDKKFYIIIPFSAIELGMTSKPALNLNPAAPKVKKLPYDKAYIIQKALGSLEPKRDHLLRQLTHLNLSARQLTTQELIHLFYVVHNPDAGDSTVLTNSRDYASPITQASTSISKIPPKTTPTQQPPLQNGVTTPPNQASTVPSLPKD